MSNFQPPFSKTPACDCSTPHITAHITSIHPMDQLRRELDDLRRTVTAQQTEIDALKRESGQASHAMNNEVMQRLAVEQKLEALEGEFREWKSSANGQTTVSLARRLSLKDGHVLTSSSFKGSGSAPTWSEWRYRPIRPRCKGRSEL